MPYAVRVTEGVGAGQEKDKVCFDIMYAYVMILQDILKNSFKHKKLNPLKARNRNSSVK